MYRKLSGEVSIMVDKEEDELSDISLVKEYPEEEKIINYLPDWLCDKDLKNSHTETLSVKEDQFWIDLIEAYLKPIDKTDEEKVYSTSLDLFTSIIIYNFTTECYERSFGIITRCCCFRFRNAEFDFRFDCVFTSTKEELPAHPVAIQCSQLYNV